MNTIAPYITPIADVWHFLTSDHAWEAATQTPGDFQQKWIANQRQRVNNCYKHAWSRFYDTPTVTGTLSDNILRFSALAFVERLVAIRQAYGFLKARFTMSNNTAGALNGVRAQPLLGAFRGNMWHIAQFVGVQYQALYLSEHNPLKFVLYSSLFEFLFYPLDTIKTLNYADVTKNFKNSWDLIVKTTAKDGFTQLWNGVFFKTGYNVMFGLNLWALSNDSALQWVTFPLWLSSYGLLTLKTRFQIAGSSLSYQEAQIDALDSMVAREGFRSLYAGFVPWAAVNILFAWNFSGLFSEEKKNSVLESIIDRAPTQHRERKYWA